MGEWLWSIPQVPTDYYLWAGYPDSPACPIIDTVSLVPVDTVVARMEATPIWTESTNPSFVLNDISLHVVGSQWLVDGTLINDSYRVVFYESLPADDSFTFSIVAYYDTSEKAVSVLRQELFSPNIFTPEEPTNNRFRGHGVNIDRYCLQIYTKWGDRIFETLELSGEWDGTYHGVKSPEGAYVYCRTYTSLSGARKTAV